MRSQASTSSKPPASAPPSTAAISGLRGGVTVIPQSPRPGMAGVSPRRKALRSMPAEKKPPAPVSTPARSSSSASSSSTASATPRATAASSALRACGRLMAVTCTAPRRSTRTSSDMEPPRPSARTAPLQGPATSLRVVGGRGALSLCLRTAGGVDDLTGHETGALADEEGHQVRDVLGLAGAGHRNLGGRALDEVVERDAHALGGRLGHVRLDEAGGDRVGGHPELAELDGQG